MGYGPKASAVLALLREMVRELEQHGQTGEPLVGIPGEGKGWGRYRGAL